MLSYSGPRLNSNCSNNAWSRTLRAQEHREYKGCSIVTTEFGVLEFGVLVRSA